MSEVEEKIILVIERNAERIETLLKAMQQTQKLIIIQAGQIETLEEKVKQLETKDNYRIT